MNLVDSIPFLNIFFKLLIPTNLVFLTIVAEIDGKDRIEIVFDV